jgi:Lon protease-like protein
MSRPHPADRALGQFTGLAPLFPLPSGVLFPHLVLPLLIFETRYRQMISDSLAGDRLIALALLRPGWENSYESKTCPIHPVVTLGHISLEERLADGRYNIMVQGLCRARVLGEVETVHLYRVGRLESLREVCAPDSPSAEDPLRCGLIHAFQERFPRLADNAELQRTLREELSLGTLCDLLCSSMQLSPEEAAHALCELDVRHRCAWLLERITREKPAPASRPCAFPPPFSTN